MSNYENFFTRPIFQNRQMVQRSGHTITLSGETIINTLGTLQISAQLLDFTGSTSASTIYNIAGTSGYINNGQPSSFIVRPPIILSAGTSATTTVDVTGFILGGLDSEGHVAWFPASNFFSAGTSGGTTYVIVNFTGNTSANCITDLYISNLYGCSPVTIHDSVVFISGKTISSSTGGGQIDLTFSGIPSSVVITSDGGAGLESILEVSSTYSLLSNAGDSGGTQSHMMGVEFFNDPGVNNVSNIWSTGVYSMINIGVSSEYSLYYNKYQDIVIQENGSYNAYTTAYNRNAVLIGSNGGQVNVGVKNSVVIGGSGLTATLDNTVYVPYLTIGGGYVLTGNTVDRVLVRSSDGRVKTISQSSLTSTGSTTTIQFTGNTSATCITDLYVTNVNSCSPLHIQPVNVGDVYILENGGKVGIGTTTPATKLEVSANDGSALIVSTRYQTGTLFQAGFAGRRANGTKAAPTAVLLGDYITAFGGAGYHSGGAFGSSAGVLRFQAAENFTAIAQGTNMVFVTQNIGTVGTPSDKMILTSEGLLGIGTSTPTAKLQVGESASPGTFRYVDGNEGSGKVLTSDASGNTSWQTSTSGVFTGNTSANCITDLYISNLYGCSPVTIHDSVVFISGKSITTNNGGGQIDLDFGGVADKVIITNDNGAFGKETMWMENGFLALYAGSSDMLIELDNISAEKGIGIRAQTSNSYVRLGAAAALDAILIYDRPTDNVRSSVFNKPAILIGTKDSVVLSGVTNSVLLGGQNITGTTNDTVYVPNLEVRGNLDMCVGGGTAFLPIISGCSPVTLQGHLVVNNQNTFGPIRPNYISELITSGMTTGGTYNIPIPAGWVVEDVIIYTKTVDSGITQVAMQTLSGVWVSGNTGSYKLYTSPSFPLQNGTNLKSLMGHNGSNNQYINNYNYFSTSDTLVFYFRDATNNLTEITDGEFKILIRYWDGSEL